MITAREFVPGMMVQLSGFTMLVVSVVDLSPEPHREVRSMVIVDKDRQVWLNHIALPNDMQYYYEHVFFP
jgi:hypothetical protein